MKRFAWISVALAALGFVFLIAQPGGSSRPIASLFPASPSLYLEARDFSVLLRDWNASPEKRLWLASDQYSVFSRSNLAQKLQTAQAEFATAAGLPPDMALLANVAGTESALALYDIGKLEFLYVTRLPSARVTSSPLWKTRATYETRKSAGQDYYLRTDKATKRVAAFAANKDYLLLATREDVLAGALALLSEAAPSGMARQAWYIQATQAAQAGPELRLVLNLPELLQSPYMRSYWIQRNASILRQYASARSDLTRQPGVLLERRELFKLNPEAPTANETAAAQISRAVPSDAGLYRAWASPTASQALDLVRSRLLEPQAGNGPDSRSAPEPGSMDVLTGSESDLETRIDEPPLALAGSSFEGLQRLLASVPLDAMLQIGATRTLPDGVFTGIDSAIVLRRMGSWDAAALRAALAAAGAEFDGPNALALGIDGSTVILATRPEMLMAVRNASSQAIGPARYAAGYRHGRELPPFLKMTRLIDAPLKAEGPSFFSQTVGSLGTSILGRLDSATMTEHDAGPSVTQMLVYKMKP